MRKLLAIGGDGGSVFGVVVVQVHSPPAPDPDPSLPGVLEADGSLLSAALLPLVLPLSPGASRPLLVECAAPPMFRGGDNTAIPIIQYDSKFDNIRIIVLFNV